MDERHGRGRRHRRAVGPPGASPVQEEPRDLLGTDAEARPDGRRDRPDDDGHDERLSAERPPHHDRGV